ncbi:hypothetical protein P3T23_002890 [Paraburkholderia sp. GAS448]
MHDVLSIEETFGELNDPRSRPSAHDLTQMLVVALCAILSGADSWLAIQDLGRRKAGLAALSYTIGPGHPLPRHIRSRLRGAQSEAVRGLLHSLDEPPVPGFSRSGRGDSPRGLPPGRRRQDGTRFTPVRSARNSPGISLRLRTWSGARSGAHGRQKQRDHGDPGTARCLAARGRDCHDRCDGCQRSIAERIVTAGADYVLACKGNQGHDAGPHLTPWSAFRLPMRTKPASIGKSRKTTAASRRAAVSPATFSRAGNMSPICGPGCARS